MLLNLRDVRRTELQFYFHQKYKNIGTDKIYFLTKVSARSVKMYQQNMVHRRTAVSTKVVQKSIRDNAEK